MTVQLQLSTTSKLLNIRVLLLAYFMLLGLSQNILMAQDGDSSKVKVTDLVKLDIEDLINFQVSSAAKINQNISDSPSLVSLVNRDQLQGYNWITINDLAAKQAGFSLGQDRFNKTINSRGISDLIWSKRFLILFDGVPFNSFQNALTDEALALNMARSVEVVRGPGAVLYGSQAVTGVVQVNSLDPMLMNNNGYVELRGGSLKSGMMDFMVANVGKQFNSLVSFQNYITEGYEYDSYDAILGKDANGNYRKYRTQDYKNAQHLYTKFDGRGKWEGFSLSYHFMNTRFQMGHGFLNIAPEIEHYSNINRNYVMARYVTPISKDQKTKQEFVLKYDREVTNLKMQILPSGFIRAYVDGSDSTGAPIVKLDSGGIFEQYITPVDNVFARAQWIRNGDKDWTVLGGIEQDINVYNGDQLHQSNTKLGEPNFKPYPNNEIAEVGPVYERILRHPVFNTGIYAQFTSGTLLGDQFLVTIGGRNDMYYYNYKDLNTETIERRFVSNFNPRLSVLYTPDTHLKIRAMYGRAFRMASPFEQFVSNSIVTGTVQGNLDPEIITTYELSADWLISKRMNWKNTLFRSSFDNQIRGSNGAFKNTQSSEQFGIESEMNIHLDKFQLFGNYTYVERISEKSNDPSIPTTSALIYYPAHSANFGYIRFIGPLTVSIQGHYQSKVDRRINEKGEVLSGANQGVNMNNYRGDKVADWFTADAQVLYNLKYKYQFRVALSNVFNRTYHYANNIFGVPQPFDYQQPGRRLTIGLKMNL